MRGYLAACEDPKSLHGGKGGGKKGKKGQGKGKGKASRTASGRKPSSSALCDQRKVDELSTSFGSSSAVLKELVATMQECICASSATGPARLVYNQVCVIAVNCTAGLHRRSLTFSSSQISKL